MVVLIVEDETEIREEVAEVLRDEGYDVVTASNGAEALAQLGIMAKPRLILLDLMMPVMDGPEFRARQLSVPGLASIPVVIVTGAGDEKRRAAHLHAAGYLAKPFRMDDLLGIVARFGR